MTFLNKTKLSFRYLFSSATDLETKGDVCFELKIAVDFNIKNEKKPEFAATVRKRLPKNVTSSLEQQLLQIKTTGKNCQVSEDNGGAEVIAQHEFAGRTNSN